MLALPLLVACESFVSTTIPLDGPLAADLVVTGEADFGDVAVGASASRSLTLTNAGAGALSLSAVTVDADGVTLAQPTLGGLAPGESRSLLLGYTPTEAGCVSGNLRITSNDPEEPLVSVPVLGCAVQTAVPVVLTLNVDDRWTAWLDGTAFTADEADDWYYADAIAWDLAPGEHLLAVQGANTGGGGALIGALVVDGLVETVSGDGSWLVMDRQPGDAWITADYDDSRWEAAAPCASDSYGPEQTGGADSLGAVWVSVASDCRDATDSWFRVRFTVD